MSRDIRSMTDQEIASALQELCLPAFRIKQITLWVRSGCESFDEMTNLPKSLRDTLKMYFNIYSVYPEKRLVSKIDGTVKYLFRLHDGEYIESVLMSYHHGHTVCISTQVGCRMGCSFCASGLEGLKRNLTASEMIAQIQYIAKDNGIRVSNVVMMGMGEPLDNFDNSVRFLRLVDHPNGLGIGMRHISLSTSGLVPKIIELAKLKLPITLSISLHAPNDEIRSKTMKVNKKWNIDQLLSACKEYQRATTRRISFEYALISGVNDSVDCARELAGRLKGIMCHVNLIPANPVVENNFVKSDNATVQAFVKTLESCSVTATVRRTLGADINASCGQLRRKTVNRGGKHVENLQ